MALLRGAPAIILLSFVSALLFFSVAWSDDKLNVQQQFIMPSDGGAHLAEPKTARKRVAIIGAGAAGSSTAYYLRRFLANSSLSSEDVSISIYDKHSYIGGRSTTVNAYDDPREPVELGASIFVDVNTNLVSAARELGLDIGDSGASTTTEEKSTDALGIWNGAKLVFTFPDGYWWSLAKVVYRYGVLVPWRTKKLTETTVGKFLNMYKAPLFPFPSLSEAVNEAGLLDATASTGLEYLEANGISGGFRDELMQSSTRVNYGQNLGLIHGLETMVCMAAEGARSVEGGNWQIFDRMVNSSRADVHLSTPVTAISQLESGEWTITSKPDGSSEAVRETFDSVVIAGPYQFSHVDISPALEKAPDEIPYVTLHVTLFASPLRLAPSYFNRKPDEPVPDVILTTLNEEELKDERILQGRGKIAAASAGFFSISTLRTITRPPPDGSPGGQLRYLYKVFSPEYFDDNKVLELFGLSAEDNGVEADRIIEWKLRKVWKSYPYEYPRVTFDEIKLASGLWYTGGMDAFISTMETNSLMGMNVAQLMVNEWEAVQKSAKEEQIGVEFLGNGELKMKAKL